MLLSVPLTITAKIALESHDDTRWVAIMLGPKVEPETVADSPPPPQDSSG
jgi:hypothetical protein